MIGGMNTMSAPAAVKPKPTAAISPIGPSPVAVSAEPAKETPMPANQTNDHTTAKNPTVDQDVCAKRLISIPARVISWLV